MVWHGPGFLVWLWLKTFNIGMLFDQSLTCNTIWWSCNMSTLYYEVFRLKVVFEIYINSEMPNHNSYIYSLTYRFYCKILNPILTGILLLSFFSSPITFLPNFCCCYCCCSQMLHPTPTLKSFITSGWKFNVYHTLYVNERDFLNMLLKKRCWLLKVI